MKAAATKDGGVGEVTEAKYDVTTGGGENSSALTPGHVLGVALLLVMGLFGFVVFAGVCTAGFNALFKTAPRRYEDRGRPIRGYLGRPPRPEWRKWGRYRRLDFETPLIQRSVVAVETTLERRGCSKRARRRVI